MLNPGRKASLASYALRAGLNAATDDDSDDTYLTGSRRGAKAYRKRQQSFLDSILRAAPYVLGGVAAARYLPRLLGTATSGAASVAGAVAPTSRVSKSMETANEALQESVAPETPTQATEPAPQRPERAQTKQPTISEKLMQGVNLEGLSDVRKGNVTKLLKKIADLEQKGMTTSDKTMRNLVTRVRSILGDKPGLAVEETERFEAEYGKENVKGKPAEKVLDTVKLEVGDLVETERGRNGRVVSVNQEKGYADVKIDKKRYRKKLEQLKQKDWNDLKSAVIQEYAYNPDIQVPLLKFRGGPWYAYQNVSPETFEKVATGQGTAKTTGEKFGIKWWKGKNPSKGAAFWKFMRENPSIPYARLNEQIDIEDFFANYAETSPDLPWKIPQPKTKKKKNRRKKS